MDMQIRKIIAKRLLESKLEVPHYYLRGHADLRTVNSLRQTFKEQGSKVNESISQKLPCHASGTHHDMAPQSNALQAVPSCIESSDECNLASWQATELLLLCRCLSMTSLSEQLLWRWQMSQEQTHSGIQSQAKWCPARALTSP